MREIEPELQAHLNSGATYMCRCWRVRRQDGIDLGFTDHDRDLEFDHQVFHASSGMNASAIESANGLSVDNAQALGALSDTAIREEDICSGRYDRARVEHWLVNWRRPDLRVLLFVGEFGEIRRADGAFEVELRGLAERLNVPVGRSMLKTCDRVLGDSRCRVDLGRPEYAAEATLLSDSTGMRVTSKDLQAYAPGWFAQGTLTWLTGVNAGLRADVKMDVSRPDGIRVLELWQQLSRPPVAGDRFRVVAGCDKRAGTCRAKFQNFLNFRGFPHIPGEDWVMAYPKNGVVHDGASQQGG